MAHKITSQNEEDNFEALILENVTKWQSGPEPLAPLTEEQLELFYAFEDKYNEKQRQEKQIYEDLISAKKISNDYENREAGEIPIIRTFRDFNKWMTSVENEIRSEDLQDYRLYREKLNQQTKCCKELYEFASNTSDLVITLKEKYDQVTAKTNSLHNLSEHLMMHQKVLKEKKKLLKEKLYYFLIFNTIRDNVDIYSNKINSDEYISYLNTINNAIEYLNININYKESRIYKMKYESLLTTALNKIYRYFNNIVSEATKQVVDPETKANLLPLGTTDSSIDSSFSLYYGKFQSAATKVKLIISHLEEKGDVNEHYKNIVTDCQKTFVVQRLPILQTAVSKALMDLKEKHKSDLSVLFRSCGLFTMKTCQDEANCYYYFFNTYSSELSEYLGNLTQCLYDILRPTLILINHVEILSELCSILRKEMLNNHIKENVNLKEYVQIIEQLLQDVEERLVFRTNIFFHYDLLSYNPSPGDLAYPEKLLQMENIAAELQERTESRTSTVSLDFPEIQQISASQLSQFRSHTGNSPADLHGMWYPTVKRTLVVLSRLYFCLDKETFQGLAQEALLICIKTVEHAANLITSRKSKIDGQLFEIKHLLILREQIAPFQVDFTAKEMSLDFSTVQRAAIELIHKTDKLFVFGSNNALLEFLLEGTPRVKEYLVDSRKEIDKQLKYACETFIANATNILVENLLKWIKTAEKCMQISQTQENSIMLSHQSFAQPSVVSALVCETLRKLKIKIPEIQKSMQLYLANRETEFILFRPIKNNVINAFIQIEQILINAKYSAEDQIIIGCPSPEQINVLICSVSLTGEQ